MHALATRAVEPLVLANFNTQEVANMSWAFARLGVLNEPLLLVRPLLPPLPPDGPVYVHSHDTSPVFFVTPWEVVQGVLSGVLVRPTH